MMVRIGGVIEADGARTPSEVGDAVIDGLIEACEKKGWKCGCGCTVVEWDDHDIDYDNNSDPKDMDAMFYRLIKLASMRFAQIHREVENLLHSKDAEEKGLSLSLINTLSRDGANHLIRHLSPGGGAKNEIPNDEEKIWLEIAKLFDIPPIPSEDEGKFKK